MLKGLLLRRLFVVADVLLAALIALFAAFIAIKSGQVRAKPIDPNPLEIATQDYSVVFAPPMPRAEFNRIISSGIFGSAASLAANIAPPPPPPKEILTASVETELPLRLKGTVLTGTDDRFSSAVIEVREGQQVEKTFFTGQAVIDKVFLKEIRNKEVVLDNQRLGRTELLKLLDEAKGAVVAAKPGIRKPTARPETPTGAGDKGSMELVKTDMQQKLLDAYPEIAETVDVREYLDESGEVAGITADNVEHIELAQELGLKNNDVLTTINNQPIRSAEDVQGVLEKYRNANNFRVGILRDGQPMYLTYRLK